MASKQTILKCFLLLSRAYPDAKIPEETPILYERLLADIPDDILEAAVLDHISNSIWFPKVAELRAAAVNIVTGIDQFQLAAEAWGDVARAIPRYGRSWEYRFDNPITMQTINALGWVHLCMSTNQIADRARFIEAYQIYLARYKRGVTTLPQVRDLAARLRMPGLPSGHLPALPFGADDNDQESLVDEIPDLHAAWDRGRGE